LKLSFHGADRTVTGSCHLIECAGKRVLISAGEFDPMISRPGSERLAAILKQGGAQVELAWQPASHGLTQPDVGLGQNFFRSLKPE